MDNATFSNKILLIDDDYYFRESVAVALGDLGYSVVTAENGLVGINVLRMHTNVDLILVDLMMPVMDGFSFLETARKEYPDLPIVVISGVGSVDKALASIRFGAWDFITKPIENEEFLKIVLDRNIEKYITYKSNKEYQAFLENLAKMRSEQLDEALSRERAAKESCRNNVSIYKDMFKKIPTPIVLVKEEGRLIVDANEAFLQSTGFTETEIVGRNFADICSSVHCGDVRLDMARWLDADASRSAVAVCWDASGTNYEARLTSIPFSHEGHLNLAMVMLDMVTSNQGAAVRQ